MISFWGRRRGEMVNTAKLDEDLVREARELSKEGMSHREIAKRMGVHQTTISRAVCGMSWSHVK